MEDPNNQATEEDTNPKSAPELANVEQKMEWADVIEPREEETEEVTDDNQATNDDPDSLQIDEDEEEFENPESVVTTEDPGEFVPKDYSFEVSLADGKTVKVTTVEEAETIADKPENFETPKQLMDFLRKAQKMENGLESDRAEWEKQKEEFEKQTDLDQAQQEYTRTLASEIEYLVSKGKLPKADKKYLDADWNDPLVAKQPGVKEQVELIRYMQSENETRIKLGLKPITSAIDAYNAWQLDQQDTDAEDTAKKRAAARKKAGGRVASTSPNPVSIAPRGIAVGRAFDLNELDSL